MIFRGESVGWGWQAWGAERRRGREEMWGVWGREVAGHHPVACRLLRRVGGGSRGDVSRNQLPDWTRVRLLPGCLPLSGYYVLRLLLFIFSFIQILNYCLGKFRMQHEVITSKKHSPTGAYPPACFKREICPHSWWEKLWLVGSIFRVRVCWVFVN